MERKVEYGYARKSSKDKNAEAQLKALREAGIPQENIYVDRPLEKGKFRQLMNVIQPGNVLVIKNLSQFGYNYQEILNEWKNVTKVLRAGVRVLDIGLLDTNVKRKRIGDTFVSDLFSQIISFVAEHERAHLRHRQADGIAHAKSQGRHLGRPRIPKPSNFNELYAQWRNGIISAEEAMTRMGLKRSTFERFVREWKAELKNGAEQKS